LLYQELRYKIYFGWNQQDPIMDLLTKLFAGGMKPPSASSARSQTQGQQAPPSLFGNDPNSKPIDNIDVKANNPMYQVFNDKLSELLTVLRQAIPENESLKMASDVHESLRKLLPGEPTRRWLEAIEGYSQYLEKRTAQNEAIFMAAMPKMSYICELDIVNYWDEFEEEAKDNLWLHLNELNALANAVGQFKPELMSKIESMAESFANEMDDDMDPRQIGATVLDSVLKDESILKLIGVDTAVAQSDEVKSQAQQMLSLLGNLNGIQ